MGRIRRANKRIRGSNGGRTRKQDCCCPEVDCTGNETLAAFSYAQVSCDSPFNFYFFDESVADGDCEPIVAWSWKEGGEEFSTDQNPGPIEFEGDGPWIVELTVTDSCGCTDTVDMVVVAETVTGCECSGAFTSVRWFGDAQLIVTGVTTPVGGCTWCPTLNGTFTLELEDFFGCSWDFVGSLSPDGDGFNPCHKTSFHLSVAWLGDHFQGGYEIDNLSTNVTALYQSADIACDSIADFSGDITLNLVPSSEEFCDYPSTIILRVPPPALCG